MKILIVEDDYKLIESLKLALNRAGYSVEVANNGIDGQFFAEQVIFDAIILDLGLPGRPGLTVLRNWRKQKIAIPVLILTARDDWHERVDGLKAGADDYVGKPFHTEELLARLEALIRRHFGRIDNYLNHAGVTLNIDQQTATTIKGEKIELTRIEFRLLHYLIMNPCRICSKTELSERVYEEDQIKESNTIEVYINRLRHYFGKNFIETRRSQGYRLCDVDQDLSTE